jgi:hypothetical protein
MRNLANIEVFNIETTERGTFAHITLKEEQLNLACIGKS